MKRGNKKKTDSNVNESKGKWRALRMCFGHSTKSNKAYSIFLSQSEWLTVILPSLKKRLEMYLSKVHLKLTTLLDSVCQPAKEKKKTRKVNIWHPE